MKFLKNWKIKLTYKEIKLNKKIKKKKSKKLFNIFIKQLIIIFFLFFKNQINFIKYGSNKLYNYQYDDSLRIKQIQNDYNNQTFVIMKMKCLTWGLFAFYKHYLGCCSLLLSKGYIPIVDLKSFKNIFNGFNISSLNINPYEIFFEQPYGYKLEDVQKKGQKIIYHTCNNHSLLKPSYNIFKNNILIDYWHNIALKYMPIKSEILKEANIIRNKLFKGSYNILGILARGTDYITRKPKSHPVQPKIEYYFDDINDMNKNYKYDWFFLTTEDDLIRTKFIKQYGKKIKFYKKGRNIIYNYKEKEILCFNKKIKGNIVYIKIYLINIIILSQCLDIITSRTSGSIAAFFFSEGFRKTKVYFFGSYK